MEPDEEVIMGIIVNAHNSFIELEQTHPSDIQDWTNAIHTLQRIMMARVTRRDYPEQFTIIREIKK